MYIYIYFIHCANWPIRLQDYELINYLLIHPPGFTYSLPGFTYLLPRLTS